MGVMDPRVQTIRVQSGLIWESQHLDVSRNVRIAMARERGTTGEISGKEAERGGS